MSINQLNLVIGVLLGLAIGIFLRNSTPPGRNSKTLSADFREPLKGTG